MRIPRLFLPNVEVGTAEVALDERARHYMKNVLRLKPGACLELFDGHGRAFDATLQTETTVNVDPETSRSDPLPRCEINLLQGICKGERMDWVIQKSTELGVTAIYPVFTEHCVVKMDSRRAHRRTERWREIAIGACTQSRRNRLPKIHTPIKLDEVLPRLDRSGSRLICRFGGNAQLGDMDRPTRVYVLIGPEGGLGEHDLELAGANDFIAWQIGARTLRSETAAIAAITLLQYHWGDLA